MKLKRIMHVKYPIDTSPRKYMFYHKFKLKEVVIKDNVIHKVV